MKLDAAAYHEIINLPLNATVSPVEAGTWKKCLLATADSKIKSQKDQIRVDLFRKLQKKGLGVNDVEIFC